MIIGCAILALFLIIVVVKTTLPTNVKEKESIAKEKGTKAKEVTKSKEGAKAGTKTKEKAMMKEDRTKGKNKEIMKEDITKAKDKEIQRLIIEVAEWEVKVTIAFLDARSVLPDHEQSDFVTTDRAYQKSLAQTINSLEDEASVEIVETLMNCGANLLLRRLHLCVLEDDMVGVEKWNLPATLAKLLYQLSFLKRMDLQKRSQKCLEFSKYTKEPEELDKFWKNSFKNVKIDNDMKHFFKECTAWLEGYIEAFKWATFSNEDINARKAELQAIQSLKE